MKGSRYVPAVILVVAIVCGCTTKPQGVETDPAARSQRAPGPSFDDRIDDYAKESLREGRKIFRYDTFGSEDFWGGKLRLHEAIAGVTARQALQLGLKVDLGALPAILV